MSALSRIPYLVSRIILPLTLLGPLASFAHEIRPAYLELREVRPGEFAVLWKTPMRGDMRLALAPEFSGRTENLTPIATRESGGAAVQTWRIKMSEPMRGQSLRIQGLDATMTDALARIEFADGTTWLRRLTPQEPAATIPARQSGRSVAGEYLKLGVEHILLGIDHLLFVLALLLITRNGMRDSGYEIQDMGFRTKISHLVSRIAYHMPLVKTITAFTVAHSITLALATLGFVHFPQAPVEAVIALSIVFVATEIARQQRRYRIWDTEFEMREFHPASRISHPASASLTARAPWIVAFTFGLLHGFGFAGALSEIGLPEGYIPLALLFFNVGVELGQLLFIAAVLALLWVVRDALNKTRDTGYGIRDLNLASRVPHPASHIAYLVCRIPNLESRLALVPPYVIGSVAMFWVMQRVAAF